MSELKIQPPRREDGEINSPLRYFLRGALEEFVDQSLIRLGLLGGEAAKLGEETRSDADGDELFGVAGSWSADAAGAAELFAGRLRDFGEGDPAIRYRLRALYRSRCAPLCMPWVSFPVF